MTTCIDIFQKNWAFTTADSDQSQIKTGSFGPCHVVTFATAKFVAMAHIDDNTDINSIQHIFNKFAKNNIEPKNIRVTILGGWKDHTESSKWGKMILQKINEFGAANVNTQMMHTKMQQTNADSPPSNHYFYGVLIDAKNRSLGLLEKVDLNLEQEQMKQTAEFVKEHGENSEILFPLEEVQRH